MTSSTQQISGTRTGESSPVVLVIPCKAEYVALGRLVAGALGAREALDEETIGDLKVIVTEVCAVFVSRPDDCEPVVASILSAGVAPSLRLEFQVSAQEWVITVSNPDLQRRILPSCLHDPSSEDGLGFMILQALVDSVEQTDDDAEGTVFHLVKRVAKAG